MQTFQEDRLKGKISTYSETVKSGVVVTEDKRTYLFSHKEWLSETPPLPSLEVYFVAARNWAKSVMPVEEQAV